MDEYLKPVDAEDEIIIFNAWDVPYKDVVNGVEIVIPPKKRVRTEKKYGMYLVQRALEKYQNNAEQRKAERQEYLKRISSTNQAIRDSAFYYCNERGEPRTMPLKNQGLFSLDTPEGKKAYEELMSKVVAIPDEPPTPESGWTTEQKYEYVKKWSSLSGVNYFPSLKNKSNQEELDRRVQATYQALQELKEKKKGMVSNTANANQELSYEP